MSEEIDHLKWVIKVKNRKIARLTEQVQQAEKMIIDLQEELEITRKDLDVFAARVDELAGPVLEVEKEPAFIGEPE